MTANESGFAPLLPRTRAQSFQIELICAHHRWWSMIFSENRFPPRIKSGAGFFRIML